MNSVSVFKTYLLICLIRLFVTPEVSEWEYKVVYAVHFRKTLMIIMNKDRFIQQRLRNYFAIKSLEMMQIVSSCLSVITVRC